MQLHNLKRVTKWFKSKAVGRGGTRGKTSGRGTKGQNARAGRKFRPEMRDAIKKLPKLRGYRFNSHRPTPVALNLADLNKVVKAGDIVTPTFLVDAKIIEKVVGKIPRIKILGSEGLTKKIEISGCLVSETAKAAIEKLGGTVTISKGDIKKEKKVKVKKEVVVEVKAKKEKPAKKVKAVK
jgi:large subunit ribosomal protein L15